MARVNVEQRALTDPRFNLLGRLLGTDRHGALGRMLLVWNECQERSSYFLSTRIANAMLEHENGAQLLVDSDLAEWGDEGKSQIRVRGTEGRVEWLAAKRERAKSNGNRGGRPKLNQEGTNKEPTLVSSGLPAETPPAPAPAPALPPNPPSGGVCVVVKPDDFSELLVAWREAKLPNGATVARTSNRVGWWQQRLADDHWRENWRRAVKIAGESPRCRGEENWAGLMIDTFLKEPDMVTRILEGEFSGKQHAKPPPTKYFDPNDNPTDRIAPRKKPEAA